MEKDRLSGLPPRRELEAQLNTLAHEYDMASQEFEGYHLHHQGGLHDPRQVGRNMGDMQNRMEVVIALIKDVRKKLLVYEAHDIVYGRENTQI